mgnify:CR=1 FL=1
MKKKILRKSVCITLVLLASVSIMSSGCSKEKKQEVSRNSYKSQKDCQGDWGNDCKSDGRGGFISPFFYYMGGYPHMYSNGAWSRVPQSAGFSRVPMGSYSPNASQVIGYSGGVVNTTTPVSGGRASGAVSSTSRGGFGGSAHGSSVGA